MVRLRTLVVDDESPIVDELAYLLAQDDRIGMIHTARSSADALRILEAETIDLVFLDIAMPGLSGLDLARVLAQFRESPKIVFVTAHEDHAVEAFELNAVDYLLKPVRKDRLAESIRRSIEAPGADDITEDITVAVELAGVTRFVAVSQVSYVEAQGDYVRLHTIGGENHLLRASLSGLEVDWAPAGFVRIHRSLLVSAGRITEIRMDSGRCSVVVADGHASTIELQVARRHTKALRERLQATLR
ncbi:LytTR family DNA-binding domain-containing protein [soil metagenome]